MGAEAAIAKIYQHTLADGEAHELIRRANGFEKMREALKALEHALECGLQMKFGSQWKNIIDVIGMQGERSFWTSSKRAFEILESMKLSEGEDA